MKVSLKYITPLDLVVDSIRVCYDSQDRSDSKWTLVKDLKRYNSDCYVLGEKDKKLIQQCITNHHESVLRHSLIHFDIKEFPRNSLQQLVRHQVGISFSVKSTRYTLHKDLKLETPFISWNKDREQDEFDFKRASKYITLTGDYMIDKWNLSTLDEVIDQLNSSKPPSNDILKNLLPECYNCDLRMSMNIQSLRHGFKVRTPKEAHYLIRGLFFKMYDCLPEDYKFMFEDCLGERDGN
jgi:thymidylate synthase (FAD)